MMNQSTLHKIMLVLLIIGALTSIYLTNNHFSEQSSACDFTETVSCSRVNSSIYSVILNVPVALIGLIWFIIAIILVLRIKKAHMEGSFILWSIMGVISIPYFIWAEIKLGAICPFCTVVHIILIAVLILSITNYKKSDFALDLRKSAIKISYWLVAYLLIFALLAAYFKGDQISADTVQLAQCLSEKNVVMYGSFICSHCIDQKNMFGKSFDLITYVECHPNGPNPQTELCDEKNIVGTPTWIIEVNGTETARHEGSLKLDNLRTFAGC